MNAREKIIFVFLFSTIFLISFLGFTKALDDTVEITVTAVIEHREPFVLTHPASSIGIDSANLHGELLTLGNETEVSVFFQYKEKDSPFWVDSPKQTSAVPSLFSITLVSLLEDTDYEFRAGVEWGLSQRFGSILEFKTGKGVPPVPPPSGPGGPSIQPRVIFQGRAYPLATLTLLKNNEIISVSKAQSNGLFNIDISNIESGTHSFSIFAQDTEGRKSVTLGFTVSIMEGRITTISGIFLSPTIDLGPTQVEKGNLVNILGQAYPDSEVKIFIASDELVKETKTNQDGKWSYNLNSGILETGEHKAKAKSIYGDQKESPFSQTIPFLVLEPGALICKGADLNFDGRVNILDFSILLYFWGQTRPANVCADINFDGRVNIVDFSIMMYWWTG